MMVDTASAFFEFQRDKGKPYREANSASAASPIT